MPDLTEDEEYEIRKTAWIAFKSSAIAGFLPQKSKYGVEEYAEEVDAFSNAVADESMKSFLERDKGGFDFEDDGDDEEDEDEDDEEEEDDPKPKRRAAAKKSRR